jgi:hypothetical protein
VSDALFAEPSRPAGRVERGTRTAVDAGVAAGTLLPEDSGMIEAALLAARALDRAETLPDKSAVYAVAQLLRPYQDAMHSLRLPTALTPATPPAPEPSNSRSGLEELLRDSFGTAE